jgi:hypothetical protein
MVGGSMSSKAPAPFGLASATALRLTPRLLGAELKKPAVVLLVHVEAAVFSDVQHGGRPAARSKSSNE